MVNEAPAVKEYPAEFANLRGHSVAVLHYDLLGGGGAEVVAIAAIQAFADAGAKVVIYSSPEASAVRALLGKALNGNPAFEYRQLTPRFKGPLPKLLRIHLFNQALSSRIFTESAVFKTYSEFWLRHPHPATFAYIHYPIFCLSLGSQGELRGLPAWHRSSFVGTAISTALRLYWKLSGAAFPRFLITNSSWTARRIAKIYSEAAVVPPPVAVGRPALKTGPLPGEPVRIVSIGRLVKAKRIFWLATQIDAVAAETGTRIAFDIIGRGAPAYIEELKKELAGLGSLDAKVHTDASSAEKDRLLASADLGVHGFPSEHFGLAVAEMMASGMPVLTPRNGGLGERLYESGQSFETAEEFRAKLRQILQDPARAAELRRANLAMSEEFSLASFSRQIVKAVESRIPQPVLK